MLEMKYNLEDKPKLLPLLLYGLQWWVITIPAIIIMGLVITKLHFGEDVAAQMLYMQKLFLIMGVTLLVQILFGHKLPLVVGPASVLLIGVLSSVASGVSVIYTSMLIGGVFILIFAMSGLIKHCQRLFTPRIIASIMLLIPITLAPTILNLGFRNATSPVFNLFFILLFMFLLIVGNKLLKGVWRSTTLVWGIVIGTLCFYAYEGFPATATAAIVGMGNQSNVSLFIKPEFDLGVILSFLFCALVLIINEMSSIQAVGGLLKVNDMGNRNKRGILVIGFANILSGATGVMGAIDYSSSVGIISSTRAASRFPLIPTAGLLIIGSFFPDLLKHLLTIPNAVMATVLLYVMISQFAAGMQMLVGQNGIGTFDDGVIVAVPLLVALLISFTPAEVIAQIPPMIRPICGNGFVMGVISLLIMEYGVFRKNL